MNEPFDAGRVATNSCPIALVATDDAALQRAQNGFAAAFVDPDACHLIDDAGIDRLSGHAVWLEVGEDRGPVLDRWLMAFDAFARTSEKPISVAMTAPLVDVVTAKLDGGMDMLVAPDTMGRAGAVNALYLRAVSAPEVADSRGLDDDRRLRRLSDEVARIAETLSRLSAKDAGYGDAPTPAGAVGAAVRSSGTVYDVSIDEVRGTIRARRMREKYFPADYFADPAWDMLLDLLAAEIVQQRVPVSSLCIAASVPATTALRWMKTLTDAGVFRRRADPRDGRRVFVELSDDASVAMRRYFGELSGEAAA